MYQKSANLRKALDLLYYSGAYRAMAPVTKGFGAILMLHRVLPGANGTLPGEFDPNGFLAVSPEFLDAAISRTKAAGLELVDLDEAARRLTNGEGARFACFTLDDGYRDNRDHALAVFERHECPLTVFVTSGFASRRTAPWWIMVERLIARLPFLDVNVDGKAHHIDCDSVAAKWSCYEQVVSLFTNCSGEAHAQAMLELTDRYGFSLKKLSEELIMGWDELAQFNANPLVTLGAHTVSHPFLARLTAAECRAEVTDGAAEMARHLGQAPRHLAYPYGQAEAAGKREFALAKKIGFSSAVTTRKGLVFAEHANHLTALPRVSLNGDYQEPRYVDVLLSGAAFGLWNWFNKLDVT